MQSLGQLGDMEGDNNGNFCPWRESEPNPLKVNDDSITLHNTSQVIHPLRGL